MESYLLTLPLFASQLTTIRATIILGNSIQSFQGIRFNEEEFFFFFFSWFLQLIQKGTKLVLEQVVTSIASVADTAEERFVPYYDLFMPSLKHIVENAVQKELRLLRGKTIECISLIGLAVGKEKVSVRCTHLLYYLPLQSVIQKLNKR